MTTRWTLVPALLLAPAVLGCGDNADEGSEAPSFSEHVYEADDPNIQYTGRIDFSDPKRVRFSAGGTYINVRFRGTGASVALLDQNLYGNNHNYFDVVIDGGAPTKLKVTENVTSFVVASGLAPTEHTLTLSKRTEPGIGYVDFMGFTITGDLLPPPERPSRKIIVIGDSITAGSGAEAKNGSPECSEDGWGQPYHNAHLSYGAVMARELEADYHVTAVSGIGLIRNYTSIYDTRPMPEVYDLLFLEQMNQVTWDTSAFVPDVVVVALGTNDFSPGDNPPDDPRDKMEVDTWVTAYIEFVNTLRGYYPDAHVFAVSSPMLGDGWPDATYTSLTDQKAGITQVVEHFAATGDDKVHEFTTTKLNGAGCGTHPDVAQHAAMATELGDFVSATVGW